MSEALASRRGKEHAMDFLTRLSRVTYNGVMDIAGPSISLFTDPVTKSTFSVQPGQTLGEGLTAFIDRWENLVPLSPGQKEVLHDD